MEHRHDTDPLSEAPLLRAIPKEDPFTAPEGFFDRFPMQVQSAIAQRKAAPWWSRWMSEAPARRIGWSMAAAALVAVVWFVRPAAADTAMTTGVALTDADWVLADRELLAELASEGEPIPGIQHDLTADELAAYLQAHDATEFLVELQ